MRCGIARDTTLVLRMKLIRLVNSQQAKLSLYMKQCHSPASFSPRSLKSEGFFALNGKLFLGIGTTVVIVFSRSASSFTSLVFRVSSFPVFFFVFLHKLIAEPSLPALLRHVSHCGGLEVFSGGKSWSHVAI